MSNTSNTKRLANAVAAFTAFNAIHGSAPRWTTAPENKAEARVRVLLDRSFVRSRDAIVAELTAAREAVEAE